MASAEVIPPGGEGKIDVTFKTKFKIGPQHKTITVESNDPDEPSLKLQVIADLYVEFGFEPDRINFTPFYKDNMPTMTVKGIGEQLADVKIESIKVQDPEHEKYYTIQVSDTGKGSDRAISLSVTPTQNVPFGNFGDILNVTTNLKNQPMINVYISADVLGFIEATPRTMVLTQAAPDQPSSGTIQIKHRDGKPFNVKSVTSTTGVGNLAAGKPKEDGSVDIVMTIPATESVFNADIIISTDLPDQPVVKVHAYKRKG